MTGIREMFSEYDGSDVDWFQLAFVLEREHDFQRERMRYLDWKRGRDPKRRAYKAKWMTAYVKRRREADPEWAAKRRERRNANERRKTAERKAQRRAA